jgi:hypothetical protein
MFPRTPEDIAFLSLRCVRDALSILEDGESLEEKNGARNQ